MIIPTIPTGQHGQRLWPRSGRDDNDMGQSVSSEVGASSEDTLPASHGSLRPLLSRTDPIPPCEYDDVLARPSQNLPNSVNCLGQIKQRGNANEVSVVG